ncbi:ATP-binding cassette domain-containing protein [Pseudoflavonifractor sp. BIOML-A14]|nr:ATP-binding cassette domain-containing protein [Pseudoflavonifractor sp. BIOML-A14]
MRELLRLEHLSYSYDDDRAALTDVSVSLYAGQRVAVLGNNGAGKSTFFLCCNGVLRPSAGDIYLDGERLGSKNPDRSRLRRAVGLVFQDPDTQIIAGTVEAEVSFGPMNLRLPREEVRRRVDAAVENLQLEDFRTRPPHYLSGGEKKRVSIADVLAMEPELLLLDEPAASLDPANARLLEQNLELLGRRGLGLVIATHDVDFAWRWAERVLVFSGGTLRADAAPERVFADDALLKQCGLQQPTLYQVGRLLRMDPPPRTVEELAARRTN